MKQDQDRRGSLSQSALALVGAGAGARLVGTAVATVAGVATTAVAVRLLGTSAYGILAFFTSILTLVATVSQIGVGTGTARGLSALDAAGDRAGLERIGRGAITLSVGIGFLGIPIIILVAHFAATDLDAATRLVFGLGLGGLLFGITVGSVTSSLARGLGRVILTEVPQFVISIGRLLVVVVLAALGHADLGALALGYGIVGLVTVGVAGPMVRSLLPHARRLFRPVLSAARELVVLSIPFAVSALSGVVVARFDVLVLGIVRPSVEVGIYEPTLRVIERLMELIPFMLIIQFVTVATRLFVRGESEAFRHVYVTVSKLAFVGSLPFVLALAAFPQEALGTLYGERFPVDDVVVWVLVAGFLTRYMFGLNGASLAASGDRRALVRTSLVMLIAMVVMALALVPPFGALGAAVATSATILVANLSVTLVLRRVAGVTVFRRDFVVTVLTSAFPIASALLVRQWLAEAGAWTAGAWCLGLWLVWVLLLVAIGVLRPSELRPMLRMPRGTNPIG